MYAELRYRHHWILGQTGTGKTTLLQQSAIEDIENGFGILYLDPHGTNALLPYIPKHRQKDIVILDFADEDYPVAWNIFENGDTHTATTFTETLKAIWGYADIATPQMDQTLYNASIAMLSAPSGTLLGMFYFLLNRSYRDRILNSVSDPVVKSFWYDFDDLAKKDQRDLIRSTLNKVQMLVADPRIRNVVGQTHSAFTVQNVLEEQKILIVNVPLSQFGEQKVGTLGSLLLSQLALNLRHNKTPFHIHIDDAFYFQTPILNYLLSNAGRHQMSLTLVTQYLSQLKNETLHSFIGNIGRKTAFKIGVVDGELLRKDFGVQNNTVQLYEQSPYEAIISTPLGSTYCTFQMGFPKVVDSTDKLIKLSRRSYASQRKHIEPKIEQFIGGMND